MIQEKRVQILNSKRKFILCILLSFSLLCFINYQNAQAAANSWRIKIHDAAVVENDIVTLGDIAIPLGAVSNDEWNKLKSIQLFAAPEVSGKPFQISKQKLEESLYYVLGDSAQYLLLPNSIAIQKSGALLREQEIMLLIQSSLQTMMSQLGGRTELVDYRIPSYIFLDTKGQKLVVEDVASATGRLSLRLNVVEMDKSIVKRYTGTVFLNLWKDVPAPMKPYNRGEALSPENLTYVNRNISNIKGEVWDGKGGPWQFNNAVGVNTPIMKSDLSPLALIKKGQRVNIVYQKGSIQINQQGEALQDGSFGDLISVRNTQSKKQIFGTVIDSGTIKIN